MKKIVIVSGLISGCIVSVVMGLSMLAYHNNPNADFSKGMLIGYTTMVLAFSLIFVAVKNFRDKHNKGVVSFKKAFFMGLYITVIASIMYVITWAIEYNYFIPDFMDKMYAPMVAKLKSDGASQELLNAKMKELAEAKAMYKNPITFTLITFSEIAWVGILISIISALILKKSDNRPIVA